MFIYKSSYTSLKIILFSLSVVLFLGSCTTNKRVTTRTSSNKNSSRKYTNNKKKRTKRTYDKNGLLRSDILNTAKKYRGIKYVYGGKSPKGFDCSGFITYVMNKNGVNIKGSSRMIAKLGKRKSKSALKKGDLVFFGSGSKVSHIAMVVNNDRGLSVIHSTSSRGVVIDDISNSNYWKKKYLFGKSVL